MRIYVTTRSTSSVQYFASLHLPRLLTTIFKRCNYEIVLLYNTMCAYFNMPVQSWVWSKSSQGIPSPPPSLPPPNKKSWMKLWLVTSESIKVGAVQYKMGMVNNLSTRIHACVSFLFLRHTALLQSCLYRQLRVPNISFTAMKLLSS